MLTEKSATVGIAEFIAETHFRAIASTVSVATGLDLLDPFDCCVPVRKTGT